MKNFSILGATLALLLFSVAGQATVIKAGYSVNLNDTDPGLVVHSADVASNPFTTMDLAVGEHTTFNLFQIWTDESSVNGGEDTDPMPISVDFSFTLPETLGGSVTGTTVGGSFWVGFLKFEGGSVDWNGPTDLYFGPKGDGHFSIALSDEDFNWGLYGINEGEYWGATVKATITLLADATDVPEPGTLALFGFGLLGLAVTARRRRHRRLG